MPERVIASAGAYLRDMREADGKSVHDVAQALRMLRLAGMGKVWPVAKELEQLLDGVEAGSRVPTPDQLRSLALVFPFHLGRFRQLMRLRAPEPANG